MKNDIWAIWGDINFLIPTVGFIVAIIVGIYFECKYLDERKKNQCLIKYAAKYTIAPLKPMRTIQKADAGTCQLGSTHIGIMTKASAIIVATKTKTALITLSLTFIKRIISKVK